MTEILKIQRHGLVTIPKEWRTPELSEGQFVEAIRREDGILFHPVKKTSLQPPSKTGGWRACVGGVSPSIVDKLQATLKKEFSKVDPEEWK